MQLKSQDEPPISVQICSHYPQTHDLGKRLDSTNTWYCPTEGYERF